MFWFKKIVGPLGYPGSICAGLFLAALFLLWFNRRQRAGKILLTAGVALFLLFSNEFFAEMIARPLERAYAPVQETREGIRWIVVLGGGNKPDPRLPLSSQLAPASLARLVEGVCLYRKSTGSMLVFTGGSAFEDRKSIAQSMKEVAVALGVDPGRVVSVPGARDTLEEGDGVRGVVGEAPFYLVTSAYHMPRALGLFRKKGLKPIPAPAEHLVRQYEDTSPMRFFPGASGWYKSERAFHEYLGLLWERLWGRI